MRRRAFTLIELSCSLVIALIILQAGFIMMPLLFGRGGMLTEPPPELVDMTCDLLRRDGMRDARTEGDVLILGRHRWQVERGMLLRDHHALIHVLRATWEVHGQALSITILPLHSQPRTVELWP